MRQTYTKIIQNSNPEETVRALKTAWISPSKLGAQPHPSGASLGLLANTYLEFFWKKTYLVKTAVMFLPSRIHSWLIAFPMLLESLLTDRQPSPFENVEPLSQASIQEEHGYHQEDQVPGRKQQETTYTTCTRTAHYIAQLAWCTCKRQRIIFSNFWFLSAFQVSLLSTSWQN